MAEHGISLRQPGFVCESATGTTATKAAEACEKEPAAEPGSEQEKAGWEIIHGLSQAGCIRTHSSSKEASAE